MRYFNFQATHPVVLHKSGVNFVKKIEAYKLLSCVLGIFIKPKPRIRGNYEFKINHNCSALINDITGLGPTR